MDAWTRGHLGRWLEHQFTDEDERQAVERVMVDGYERDPERYDRVGWWALYDDVRDDAVRAMLALPAKVEKAADVCSGCRPYGCAWDCGCTCHREARQGRPDLTSPEAKSSQGGAA